MIVGLLDRHSDRLGACGHPLFIERESGHGGELDRPVMAPGDGVLEVGRGIVVSRRGQDHATGAAALTQFALVAAEVHTVSATAELSNSRTPSAR
ncbi:hypothetical protein [Streptomyces tendae]|uniref:hypothetical protein n=1 Tax=Streptomyces tendae TaxID=1932 RepID=UPI003651B067